LQAIAGLFRLAETKNTLAEGRCSLAEERFISAGGANR
jgi:hypothetical protein